MLKTLLSINEDLASSIALRYTGYLHRFIPLSLYVAHVETPDEDKQVGTGWVRRAWTDGVTSTGKRLIDRCCALKRSTAAGGQAQGLCGRTGGGDHLRAAQRGL